MLEQRVLKVIIIEVGWFL